MDEKGYVGLKITPMQEFWVDCYTTAVYSMLLTCNKIDREYIYNNRYVYFHDVNEKKNLGRIYIKTRTQEVADELLTEKEEHDFVSDDHFAESMKKYIDAGKTVMLGIDMFYGIEGTSKWHKHHVKHLVVVAGYDDSKKEFAVMETGSTVYMEFRMSYEDLERAAKGYNGVSCIYRINSHFSGKMYDLEEIRSNARKIIDSIDEMEGYIDGIWKAEEDLLLSMGDEIESHLKSMEMRSRANSSLFAGNLLRPLYPDHSGRFKELEKNFKDLKLLFTGSCEDGTYYEKEAMIKERFRELIATERKLWTEIL